MGAVSFIFKFARRAVRGPRRRGVKEAKQSARIKQRLLTLKFQSRNIREAAVFCFSAVLRFASRRDR